MTQKKISRATNEIMLILAKNIGILSEVRYAELLGEVLKSGSFTLIDQYDCNILIIFG